MLSNTCKYGIRAVIYLALNGKENEKIDIKRISKDLKIPTPFLAKILQTLAKQKILISTKGPHGGFSLGRSPKDIHLIDIVNILDGQDVFNICLIGLEICDKAHSAEFHCPIHDKFVPIKTEIIQMFTDETIESLIDNIKNSGKNIKI